MCVRDWNNIQIVLIQHYMYKHPGSTAATWVGQYASHARRHQTMIGKVLKSAMDDNNVTLN